MRLDVYLTKQSGLTRSQVKNAIDNGQVTVNGEFVKAGYIICETDIVEYDLSVPCSHSEPEDIPLDIRYEDEHLMIINKPVGMVVHPGNGNRNGTLLNALLYRLESTKCLAKSPPPPDPFCKKLCSPPALERAGIVHRLDKNTSGLMVVAKTVDAQGKLAKMFEDKEVKRIYHGVVEGVMHGSGTIDKNIIRHPKHRTLFTTADKGGRRAVTHWTVLENRARTTLVEFRLETGRTHQIRVHAKSIGHPLVDDPEYNPKGGKGQELVSVAVELKHPVTGVVLELHHPSYCQRR